MKRMTIALSIVLGVGHLAAAGEIQHRFMAVDNGKHMLRYIDQFDSANNWTVATDPKPRDIRLSEDGKTFLISVNTGAVEYELASGKRTGFAITGHRGIQSAQKLKDGNYLLATAGEIFICDPKGVELKRIPVASGSRPNIRLVTVTKDNTLLYVAMKPYCINEIDMDGKPLARIPLPDKSYKARRLETGNYLASSGDSVSVFEVNPKGEVVKTYGGKKAHPELDLTFNSGWQLLKNGNVVATCWHGHGYKGNGPHLVEYSADNRAVWSWSSPDVKQVTNVLILDQ